MSRTCGDPKFAREFLLDTVEEGVPVQVALGKVIRVLNRLLRPLKLPLTLAPIELSQGRRAA